MKKIFYLTAIIFSLLLTSSCKKDPVEETTDPTEKKYELDYKANALIQVESIANEMEFIGRNVPRYSIQFPNGGIFLGVASITRTISSVGEDITLDFGAGAMCTDGKHRSGKVVIEYNHSNDDTMLRTQNYKVDNIGVNGDYSIGHVSTQTESYENFIALSGASIVKDSQNKIEFNLSRKSKQMEGDVTTNLADDVFDRSDLSYFLTVTENGKATTLQVKGLTTTSISKLKNSCSNKYFPVNGQVKVEYAATGTSTDPNNPLSGAFYFTFGDGNCGDKSYTQKSL